MKPCKYLTARFATPSCLGDRLRASHIARRSLVTDLGFMNNGNAVQARESRKTSSLVLFGMAGALGLASFLEDRIRQVRHQGSLKCATEVSIKQQASMRKPPLRFGVIGAGAMGKQQIRNITSLGHDVAEVVAVFDPDEQARAEAISELGANAQSCKAFESYADLLACDSVDAVVVCTPDLIDVLRVALRSTNKHILSEKPPCTAISDVFEVERLLAERNSRTVLAGEHRGIFLTGMEYKWMPRSASCYELREFVKKSKGIRPFKLSLGS